MARGATRRSSKISRLDAPVLRGAAAARWYARFFRDPVRCICRAHREFGTLLALGNVVPRRSERLDVLALGPEYNRQVLGDPARFRSTGQSLAGPEGSAQRRVRYGLTRMTGRVHDEQRALLMPLFQKKQVETYFDDFARTSRSVIDTWPVGRPLNMVDRVRELSLRISSDILFDREHPDRAVGMGRTIKENLTRNFAPRTWMFPLDLPFTPYRRLLRGAEEIEAAMLELIEERRRHPGGTDIFAVLVRAHDSGEYEMDETALIGQATVLFAASYETMATALMWTIFLLAQHPAVMHDVMAELDAVLDGDTLDAAREQQVPLLVACIKESMRVLPPVPFTVRATTEATPLGAGMLHEGARVICSHYLTHHLPELFPDPERFQPERWFTIKPGPFEYLPFSAGPRMCIGRSFAMSAMAVALSVILPRFRMTVVPDARIDRVVRVTMQPRHLPMVLLEQDREFRAAPVRGQINEMVEPERSSGATSGRPAPLVTIERTTAANETLSST